MNHLAIYSTKAYGEDYIAMMLSGKKSVDSKFSFRRTAPYEQLNTGDIIYFKESSGPIRGRVRVGKVVNSVLETDEDVMSFLAPVADKLGIKDEVHLMRVFERQLPKKYVCQWTMEEPETIAEPVYIIKRDQRSWVANYQVPDSVLAGFVRAQP